MGFSLTKEHLDRLREKLHVIDELHARAGGVEPVDPKETFFEALKKRKANLSRSQISEEDILVKLQETKAEISDELHKAIQRLQMELNDQILMLIKKGRDAEQEMYNMEAASYSSRMSQEVSRDRSEESLQRLHQVLKEFFDRHRRTEEENKERYSETMQEIRDLKETLESLASSFEKSLKVSSETEKFDSTKLQEYVETRLKEYAHELHKEIERLKKENILLKATLDAEKEKNQKK